MTNSPNCRLYHGFRHNLCKSSHIIIWVIMNCFWSLKWAMFIGLAVSFWCLKPKLLAIVSLSKSMTRLVDQFSTTSWFTKHLSNAVLNDYLKTSKLDPQDLGLTLVKKRNWFWAFKHFQSICPIFIKFVSTKMWIRFKLLFAITFAIGCKMISPNLL